MSPLTQQACKKKKKRKSGKGNQKRDREKKRKERKEKKRKNKGKKERKGTNLQNKGLISADRGTKATLNCLQYPVRKFKSSTKDLSLPIFELVIRHGLLVSRSCCGRETEPLPCYDLELMNKRARSPPISSPMLMHVTLGKRFNDISPHNQQGFWLRGVQP